MSYVVTAIVFMCIGYFLAALTHSASAYSREGEDE